VLVFFTVFLTLILAAKALDLWAILTSELGRFLQIGFQASAIGVH
jgi:hypothetical protein